MQYENNPLTPHLDIYSWQISSFLSITHRIVGVLNIIATILICFWVIIVTTFDLSYNTFFLFINSYIGKFLTIGLCWTFSYHILNEVRHLAWDMGYGFDLKTSKITGVLTIVGSIVLAIMIYIIGKKLI